MSVEDVIGKYENAQFGDEAEAIAALAEMTYTINKELGGDDAQTLTAEDRGERLRKWVERLAKIAKQIAEKFGALSFSITVGFPAGVSVTVTFSETT